MIKILIAEHDPTDLEMIQKELFNGGVNYIAEVVKTETDFIEVLKTFIPDIILSDYTFPSFDGLAAFKIKEQLYPDTPFIIISGTIGEEQSIDLIKNGVTDFVLKDKIFTLNTKLIRALKDAEERKQKKKTDKELAKSESHLAEAQKLAKMGSWDYDVETGRLTASKELYNVFSVDQEKFSHTYDSYLNLIDEEDRLLVQQTTTHTHLTGAPFTLEYHITTANGEKRIIREQGYGKKDKTGKIIAVFGTAQDITATKKNEQLINESEKRYRQIVETAQEGIWLIDEDHKTTFVNNKMCQILEYPEAEIMGKEIYYFMDEEGKQIAAEFKEKMKQRHSGQINKKYLSKTGKEIWANVSVNPLFNEDGTSQGSLAMVTDITERKKIEVNLHESEKKYRQIVETAQEGIWLIDQDNKTTFVNNKMCEILAYTEAEMMGKEIYCFMDEEGKQIAAELMEKKKQGHSGQHNFKYLSKSGKEIWTNLSANPLFNADGTYQGSLAMVTDITESKMAEDRNQFQATLLNTIGQAAIATDMQGKINFWNKAASSIYGWTAEEVLGKNIVDITPAKQSEEQAEQIMHELMQGNTWSGEFIVRRKNGSEFPAFITNAPIYNQQQQLIGIVGVSYDITSRKLAEQQLKESNERYKQSEIQLTELNTNLQVQAKELAISNADLEQFAYIASHDLQEPLRMITSFITQLQKKYGAVIDDKGKQYMDFVMDGAIRMRQIILDLLEFSRVGRAENMRENVDLNELIDEIQLLFRKQILEKKAIIIYTQLPIINGFRSPVRQVFQNLISNALKYSATDKAVEIKITCTDLNDHWQFAVRDNGIGIEQEYFDRIFIIFQRLHNKEKFSGTGMGLAITKKIIEGQGGRIWVESEAGKGSTFYFTLLKATR